MFQIGFLPVRIIDLIEIAIVGYLIFQVYKLLRGSIAFNIFVGVVVLYLLWALVGLLKMDLLSMILNQFVNVGFIIIIIIFQPEVRRFLLMLGNTTLGKRTNTVLNWFTRNLTAPVVGQAALQEVKSALIRMGKTKTGALIVFSHNLELDSIGHSGTVLNAEISQSLLLSIFQKESPLHDGAVVIGKGKILAASCILPVSDSSALPASTGLRHRAGLAISERTNATAFIVSEQTGKISFTSNGKIEIGITEARLNELLFLEEKAG